MRPRQTQRTLATILAFGVGCMPAFGCASLSYTEYTWSSFPMQAKEYTHGHLGVVKNTFDSQYLVVAYRYFSGKNLTNAEADEANEMIEHRIAREDTGCSAVDMSDWLNARKEVLGETQNSTKDAIETSSTIPSTSETICNIQTNAFVTAAGTLRSLVTKFGAKSADVKEWISAQDKVFDNAANRPVIPPPLTDGDKLLAQHRNYQIAAANFYAFQFDQAYELFSKIGEDATSPWSHLAKYLAVRSLIRKASLAADPFDEAMMKAVKPKLDALLKDSSMAELHDDLLDLADFVANKIESSNLAFARQREHHLAAAVMSKLTDRNLMEYTDAFDRMTGQGSDDSSEKKTHLLVAGVDDITDWIETYHAPKAASKKHAIERYNATKSVPWLIAALAKAEATDRECKDLLDEAAKIQPANHAYATVMYQAARLLTAKKQYDRARECLDKVLAQKDLDLSSRNLVLELRMRLARNINEFAHDSLAPNVGYGGDSNSPNDEQSKVTPTIMTLADEMYDKTIPLSVIKAACESKLYSGEPLSRLARMGFVRAVLLDNEAVARALATGLISWDKKHAALFKSYLSAATPADRKFAAVYFMLLEDSSTPRTDRGASYWWSGQTVPGEESSDGDPDPAGWDTPIFLSATERQAAASEAARLSKIPAAPNYLGTAAINWAKSHPQDPRVPEALHYAVSCTRYGDRDSVSPKVSKEAFLILHHKYPKNSWTDETPYYY